MAIHTVAGKKGLYTGSSGLYVAYMSGTEGTSSDSTHFTNSDIDALRMPLVSNSKFQGKNQNLKMNSHLKNNLFANKVKSVTYTF